MKNSSVLNALWRILTGERIEPGNAKLMETISLVDQVITNLGSVLTLMSFISSKVLRTFEAIGLISLTKNMDQIFDVIDDVIGEHKATIDKDNLKDFVDCFLVRKNAVGNDVTHILRSFSDMLIFCMHRLCKGPFK